jgi:multidrug efflux pump subunit AcrA (membrane-fusion protein)
MGVVVRAEGDSTSYASSLTALGPGIDSLTNAGQAVIRVPNAGHKLRPGLGATATVRLGSRKGVLSVPEQSLVVLGGVSSIFVVGADTAAHAREVATGVRHGGRVEVTGDSLVAGASVVTTGAAGLQDGMKVVTAKAEPEPAKP